MEDKMAAAVFGLATDYGWKSCPDIRVAYIFSGLLLDCAAYIFFAPRIDYGLEHDDRGVFEKR